MQNLDRIRELPNGLIQWYEFHKGGRALYVSRQCTDEEALAEALKRKGLLVTCMTVQEIEEIAAGNQYEYDYIVLSGVLELCADPVEVLNTLYGMLSPHGRMLLGVNNRFGVRYFCGDRDPYTGRSFDGIENYRRAYSKEEDGFQGRMYAKHEWEQMLRDAGFEAFHFYSVLSDLDNPALIYAEDYLPNEDLSNRVFPTYNYPDSVFLEEEALYGGLIENGMFHQMANAYLIECSLDGTFSDVCHVTSSIERGREDALYTIIHRSGMVEKRAVYPEGQKRIEQLLAHGQDLKLHGISVVEAQLKDGAYVMPYVDAQVGQIYLKQLMEKDKDAFLAQMDHFRDLIMQSSEIVSPDQDDGEGAILRKVYLDMVPLNSFYCDGEFLFYDQEFCVENYPANVLLYRMIATLYAGNMQLEKFIPRQVLLERYGLMKNLARWQKMEWTFLSSLRKEGELRVYHEKCWRNSETVYANRQRMNYSEEEYQNRFVNIFGDLGNKKLLLFGSGAFTKRFLAMYGKDYEVAAIIDNNESRQGQFIDGIQIQPPDILKDFDAKQYKILICIKNYLSVVRQLEDMGITEYGIFDSGRSYAKSTYKQTPCNQIDFESQEQEKKKYHIGYVAGVFDLFHIGHVRLLQKAKEQCEYLIVGVVSDEDCYRQKDKYPVIPFEERVEVLKACKYVDRVEVLPTGYGGIRDAYKMFQFDVQFSGDDHGTEGNWLADKEYLNKHGADLVFFDYTKETSSTEIRNRIQ